MVLSKMVAEGFANDGRLVAKILECHYSPSGRVLYTVKRCSKDGTWSNVATHLRKETAEMLVEDIVEYVNWLNH